MTRTSSTSDGGMAPWQSASGPAPMVATKKFDWGRALPLLGPVVLLIIWDLT